MDQDVNTTSDVKFNSLEIPTTSVSTTSAISFPHTGSTRASIISSTDEDIKFKLNNTERYVMHHDYFRPNSNGFIDLGRLNWDWRTLYTQRIIIPDTSSDSTNGLWFTFIFVEFQGR